VNKPSLDIKSEAKYLTRYAGAGMINSAVGLGTIAILTVLNVNPISSNVLGFAIGMLSSFLLAKFFVFKKRSNTKHQIKRYVAAFTIAYALNLFILVATKDRLPILVAQGISITTYVVAMYVFMRYYIFTPER